jgi:hypothetical protein
MELEGVGWEKVNTSGRECKALNVEEGDISKEYMWPPEAEKSKGIDLLLGTPEDMEPRQHFDFRTSGPRTIG